MLVLVSVSVLVVVLRVRMREREREREIRGGRMNTWPITSPWGQDKGIQFWKGPGEG